MSDICGGVLYRWPVKVHHCWVKYGKKWNLGDLLRFKKTWYKKSQGQSRVDWGWSLRQIEPLLGSATSYKLKVVTLFQTREKGLLTSFFYFDRTEENNATLRKEVSGFCRSFLTSGSTCNILRYTEEVYTLYHTGRYGIISLTLALSNKTSPYSLSLSLYIYIYIYIKVK